MLQGPNGLSNAAAAFSNIIAAHQSMQLAMALSRFGQQSQQQVSTPLSAQTGGMTTPMQTGQQGFGVQANIGQQVYTAYALAVLDQV